MLDKLAGKKRLIIAVTSVPVVLFFVIIPIVRNFQAPYPQAPPPPVPPRTSSRLMALPRAQKAEKTRTINADAITNKIKTFLSKNNVFTDQSNLQIHDIDYAPLPGFYQVALTLDWQGRKIYRVLYIDYGLQKAIIGQIYSLETGRNISGSNRPPAESIISHRVRINLINTPIAGNRNAMLSIVAFSNFSCARCKELARTISRLMDEYGDRAVFGYKHYPNDPYSLELARAAAAAWLQGSEYFWSFYEKLYNLKDTGSAKDLLNIFTSWADELNMNRKSFERAYLDQAEAIVQKDIDQARNFGLPAPPVVIIGGEIIVDISYQNIKQTIERTLEEIASFQALQQAKSQQKGQ